MNLNFQVPSGFTARSIDETGTITYVGYSKVGEPDDGQWSIQRIEETGAISTITYADGAWDERQTLTYR